MRYDQNDIPIMRTLLKRADQAKTIQEFRDHLEAEILKRLRRCGHKNEAARGGVIRTVDTVNAEMQQIFKQYGINPGTGEEMFWEAVDAVTALDPKAGKQLLKLAEEWDSLQ